ncbi:hypothetical protein [Pseudoalteromonas umbrosa]|uniref:hypothetical protein n=1 Tax=Pseudoalteromonas umbrosa TaxID=3048489 RepID=UPI0024C44763|nr:hypothetical protein [Pseudoalteromonas sp. B95]MDK1290061.1 hypothetical protein [Pseudoalteromonas sp. B95]
MWKDILDNCKSPEVRRALFLNEQLSEGHTLERHISGEWTVERSVDQVDLLLNPNDYRVHIEVVKGGGAITSLAM